MAINIEKIKELNEQRNQTAKWLGAHSPRWNSKNPEKERKAIEREIAKYKEVLAQQETELFGHYQTLFTDLGKMWIASGLPDRQLKITSRLSFEEIARHHDSSWGTIAYINFRAQSGWFSWSFGISLVEQDAGKFNCSTVLRIACDPVNNTRTLRYAVYSAEKIEYWARGQMESLIGAARQQQRKDRAASELKIKAADLEKELIEAGYNIKVTHDDFSTGHPRVNLYDAEDELIGTTTVNLDGNCRVVRLFPKHTVAIGNLPVTTMTLDLKGSIPIQDVLRESLALIKGEKS